MFSKSTRYMLFAIIAIFVLLCALWWYFQSDWRVRSDVENQIDQLVAKKDINQMKALALDDKTLQFLSSVPKDAKCEKTSDYQGQNSAGAYYYVTVLDQQVLDVYIKEETPTTGLFHLSHWRLEKITAR